MLKRVLRAGYSKGWFATHREVKQGPGPWKFGSSMSSCCRHVAGGSCLAPDPGGPCGVSPMALARGSACWVSFSSADSLGTREFAKCYGKDQECIRPLSLCICHRVGFPSSPVHPQCLPLLVHHAQLPQGHPCRE